MNTRIRTFWLISLFVLLPATSQASDKFEPNNKFAEAKPLKPGQSFEYSINPVRDQDFFKIEATEPGYFRVHITPSGIKHLNPVVRIYDAKHKQIGHREARVVKGTYFIRITDDYNDRFSPKNLQARVEFLKEKDTYETNNDLKDAKTVNIGEPVTHTIMPVRDYDWFKVEVPEAGYVSVSSVMTGKKIKHLNPFVWLYTEDGKPIGRQGLARVNGPMTIYIRINDDYNDRSSMEPITTKVSFTPETDLNEPNDRFNTASTVELNSWNPVMLHPGFDQDYFSFTLEHDGIVGLRLLGLEKGQRYSVWLYDSKKKHLACDVRQCHLPKGQYFLLLKPYGKTFSKPFYFRLRHVPEPYNASNVDRKNPLAVKLNETYESMFTRRGERRWFRFSIKQNGYLKIVGKESGSNMHLFGEIYKDGKRIAWGEPFFQVGPGEYIVGLFNNRSSPVSRFWFTAAMEKEIDANEPVNSKDQAKLLSTDKPVPVILYPRTDRDWFYFDAPGSGTIHIMVTDVENENSTHNKQGIRFVWHAPGRKRPYGSYGVNFTYKIKKGRHYFSFGRNRDDRTPLNIHTRWLPDTTADGKPKAKPVTGTTVITLVGLSLNKNEQAWFRDMARRTGSLFVNAREKAEFGTKIETAIETAIEKTGGGSKFTILAWLTFLILAGVIGYLVYRKTRGPES